MAECSSYHFGSLTCRDGFVQKAACRDGGVCWSCGSVTAIPNCLRDELPPHCVKDDGSPRFYAGRSALGEGK